MRKITLLLLTLGLCHAGYGQPIKELWKSLPDHVIQYLDSKMRTQMIDNYVMGLSGTADHLLEGKSSIDTLTTDYMSISVNSIATMQLKRLPYSTGDSIICVVQTWRSPLPESKVSFYRQDWTPIAVRMGDKTQTVHEMSKLVAELPSTLSPSEADTLRSMVEFKLASATLSPYSNSITIGQTAPLTTRDDEKTVARLLRPIVLNWDGTAYVPVTGK